MTTPLPNLPIAQLAQVAARHPGLGLLVLHGSRARGQAHARSDWDFAFLADADLDVEALRLELTRVLASDAVDLADLARASAVLRMHVARDGVPVLERRPDAWFDFRAEALTFWCDAGPIIQKAQAEFLASLGPAPEVP